MSTPSAANQTAHANINDTHRFSELETRGASHSRDEKRHVDRHAPHAVEDHDLEQEGMAGTSELGTRMAGAERSS